MKDEEQLYVPLTFTRHTYSRANTKRFKDIIDKCINKKTDEFISAESQGVSVLTLRHRISEALLWLCNNDVEDSSLKKEDYIQIRPFLKTTPVSYGNKPGILLSWKVAKFNKALQNKVKARDNLIEAKSVSVPNQISRLSVSQDSNKNLHWKDRVIAFITDESAVILDLSKPEDFRNIPLSEIDVEWLATTFSKGGLEFEVEEFSIRAVKG